MSQEIIDGIHAIEGEKGIEEGVLITALEDALRAAYKKTPGAARHAEVKLDTDGEFRVYAIEIPADIEERLVEEAREARILELEQLEEETGERQHTLISDDDLELDWSQVPVGQIHRTDVTPDNFGRIAAQTAKQVIQQRIREAERAIMYEEYVDRQGEVVTGIVQQAGDRNNVLVDLGRVEALLPRSEQVDGERYEQGSRIKAAIIEVRSGTKGPQVILSRRDPRPATARRSRSSRTCRASTPSAHASVPAARACAWSSRSFAVRRSTSSRGTPSLRASSRRRCRRLACARCTSTTRRRRRPSSCPTISWRSRSARRA
jgi:N utilization substance protein A